MKLFLCEKPSQAKDIAKVLGATKRKEGYIEGHQLMVTWGFGHLISACPPEVYSEELADFGNIDPLPVLPDVWKMQVLKDKKKQVNTISSLLKKSTEVVIATDADREGEVIARELLAFLNYRGKISRLWLQSLDGASIKKALSNILPGTAKESLYHAGLARSHADWLVGMNLTRIYTKAYGLGFGKAGLLSVGRVQTPTLALVVERDLLIENYKPYPYYGLKVHFQTHFDNGRRNQEFEAIWQIPDILKNEEGYCVNQAYVNQVAAMLMKQGCMGEVVSAKQERIKRPAPLPYSLSELQKEVSKTYGVSPTKVLEVAQSLYEKYKVTSYPRTPCQYLPLSQKIEVPEILEAVVRLNPDLCDMISKADPTRDARVWSDTEVNKASHHAIIPTTLSQADISSMAKLERDVYRLIVLRYIAQFYPDYEYDSTIILTNVAEEQFKSTATIPRFQGWKAILLIRQKAQEDETVLLPPLTEGDQVSPNKTFPVKSITKPPAFYTESTLLDEMKTLKSISKRLEADPKLKKIAKETQGLGTEATRANIIDRLLKVGYLEKNKKKQLISTEKGRRLIDIIPDEISDPVTTTKWEMSLAAIEAGSVSYERFMAVHKKTVAQLVEQAKEVAKKRTISTFVSSEKNTSHKKKQTSGDLCPTCEKGQLILREFKDTQKKYLGCSLYPECRFFQWATSLRE